MVGRVSPRLLLSLDGVRRTASEVVARVRWELPTGERAKSATPVEEGGVYQGGAYPSAFVDLAAELVSTCRAARVELAEVSLSSLAARFYAIHPLNSMLLVGAWWLVASMVFLRWRRIKAASLAVQQPATTDRT
jgi:hypothetical protein